MTPFFPPIEESTCDNRVVGILTNFKPLLKIFAAKPDISPVIPPPIEIKQSFRLKFFFKSILRILLILFFFSIKGLHAEEYNFEVSKIELKEKGNIINAFNGKIISKNNDLKIEGERFKYVKDDKYLEAFNGTAYLKKENIKIEFYLLKVKNNDILEASNGVKIDDAKINKQKIDKNKILENRIVNKKNQQLERFSLAYFNKVKQNIQINEF